MKDQRTKQRQAWLAKLQRFRIKRNRAMAVPICEPMSEGIQKMMRGMA